MASSYRPGRAEIVARTRIPWRRWVRVVVGDSAVANDHMVREGTPYRLGKAAPNGVFRDRKGFPGLDVAGLDFGHRPLDEVERAGRGIRLEVAARSVALERIAPFRDRPFEDRFGRVARARERDLHALAGRLHVADVHQTRQRRDPEPRQRAASGVECEEVLSIEPSWRHHPGVLLVEVTLLRARQRVLVPRMPAVDRIAQRVVRDEQRLVVRVWLPPDANTTLSIMDHCLRSTDHVNLIVVDKQPHLQYLTLDEAHRHNAAGAGTGSGRARARRMSVRTRAGLRGRRTDPGGAGRGRAAARARPGPEGSVRERRRPDGAAARGRPPARLLRQPVRRPLHRRPDVVFAFHGYPRAVHQLIHGRSDPGRFHVRGFSEQGTTTTPFDMVVLNRMSRFHLAQEVLRRASRRVDGWDRLQRLCEERLAEHATYIREHLEDMPDITDWTWRG